MAGCHGEKLCGHVSWAMIITSMLPACAYDPYIDNLRAPPAETAPKSGEEAGTLSGPTAAMKAGITSSGLHGEDRQAWLRPVLRWPSIRQDRAW